MFDRPDSRFIAAMLAQHHGLTLTEDQADAVGDACYRQFACSAPNASVSALHGLHLQTATA